MEKKKYNAPWFNVEYFEMKTVIMLSDNNYNPEGSGDDHGENSGGGYFED